MNVLVIAGIFPPDIGGPANYIPRLAKRLTEQGHQVSVLCFSDKTYDANDDTLPYKVIRIQRRQFFVVREICTIIKGLSLALKSQLIYANGNDFKAMIIGFLSHRPRIHKIVGDTSWERARNRRWTSLNIDDYQLARKGLILTFLDWVRAFPLRTANTIITPSYYLKKIVVGWGIKEEKVKMIYNSFEPLPQTEAGINLSLDKNLVWMSTICRLVPWKGVEDLIYLVKETPKLGLVIIGDGPLEASLGALSQSLGLNNRIIFAGSQPRKNIQYFLEKTNFFILNSSYEGLPHVVLEAMSCKKLVVASAAGGTPELVHHQKTGLLYPCKDGPALQNCIEQAMNTNHPTLIEQAYENLNSNFSFEKMYSETESTLQESITSR